MVNKLLEYLDKSDFGDAQVEVGPAVGVENVKSRTTRKDLALQKKDDPPPPASAPEGRAQEGGFPAAILVEPQKKVMRIEQELQLDVKTISAAEREEGYGYIITDSE